MTHTVKFRLTDREFDMLQKIAKDASLSVALRQMVHDEWDRQKGKR